METRRLPFILPTRGKKMLLKIHCLCFQALSYNFFLKKWELHKIFYSLEYGVGNDNPLQYTCLENSMDRGALLATVHGVTRADTKKKKEKKKKFYSLEYMKNNYPW